MVFYAGSWAMWKYLKALEEEKTRLRRRQKRRPMGELALRKLMHLYPKSAATEA